MRLYLNNEAAGYTPDSWKASWDDTSGAVTKKLGTSKSGSTATVGVAETSTSSTWQVALGRFVSDALATAVTIDYLACRQQMCAVMSESDLAADMRLEWMVWVTTGDTSTVRGTIINERGHVDELGGTTLLGEASVVASANNTFTAQVGDRIVLEVGYRAYNTSATSYTGTLEYGGTGSDASQGSASGTVGWLDVGQAQTVSIQGFPYKAVAVSGTHYLASGAAIATITPTPATATGGTVHLWGDVTVHITPGVVKMGNDQTVVLSRYFDDATWQEHFDDALHVAENWWVRNVTNDFGYVQTIGYFPPNSTHWVFVECVNMLTIMDSFGILGPGLEVDKGDYIAVASYVPSMPYWYMRASVDYSNNTPAWGIVFTELYTAPGPYQPPPPQISSDPIPIQLTDYYCLKLDTETNTMNIMRVTGESSTQGALQSEVVALAGIAGVASPNPGYDYDYFEIVVQANSVQVWECWGDDRTKLVVSGSLPYITGSVGFTRQVPDGVDETIMDYIGVWEQRFKIVTQAPRSIWLVESDETGRVILRNTR